MCHVCGIGGLTGMMIVAVRDEEKDGAHDDVYLKKIFQGTCLLCSCLETLVGFGALRIA